MLRCLLVQCAHYILGKFGPDSDLRRWGLALAERGGKSAKKRAVVAVARKLSVIMLSMWKSSLPYAPNHSSATKEQTIEPKPETLETKQPTANPPGTTSSTVKRKKASPTKKTSKPRTAKTRATIN